MQTLKVVEEIKHLAVRERGALIREKDALQKRYHDGINFFLSEKRRTKEDIEKADKTIHFLFDQLDRAGVPFWAQNSAIAIGENWREYEKRNLRTLFKNKGILEG